jgi:uncharacterized protein YraI
MTYAVETRRKSGAFRLLVLLLILLLALAAIAFLLLNNSSLPGGNVRARTRVSVNLREGPGVAYPRAGGLPAGTEVTVVGRDQEGAWLLVDHDGKRLWMTSKADYVEIDQSALAALPVVEVPPLAYNAGNPQVNQVLNQIPLVVHHPGGSTCASHAGLNNLLPSVASGNIIGPHSGDFVLVGKENVLFEYSDGSFQLIRDNPIARFEGGEKYISLATALKMFEQGEIVWTGSFGDWPARGVPGCDESSKPD